ncbi:MAG: PKD domain-containing protein, partial [Planctomycetota bacterium]
MRCQVIYYEKINFLGKAISVRSSHPDDANTVGATIIDAGGVGSVVTFANGEGPDAVLRGFTITGGYGTVNAAFAGHVYWGGGVYCQSSSPTITGNVIAGNHGPAEIVGENPENWKLGYGGGIGCIESAAVISGNIIRGNDAYVGGALTAYLGDPRISSNLMYDNWAETGGGVILVYGGRLINNTVVANSAPAVGNVYAVSDTETGDCLILSNIVCNAVGGGGLFQEGSGGDDTIRYNNVWGNAGGNYVECPDQTGISGNISQNPLFVSLAGDDYHLQADSPCINAGDPDFVAGPAETDFDGEARIFAVRVDIGADEYVGYMKPVADAGPDQCFKAIQLVTLDGSGSYFFDPCGIMLFRWTQVAGPAVTLSDPNAVEPSFMPEFEGQYRFQLVVSDNSETSEPDEVLISVGNQPPAADAGPDATYLAGQRADLDGTGSYDPDPGDELNYRWTQVAGPNVILVGADTATPYFDCNDNGLYRFELVVNDGFEDSEADVVEIVALSLIVDQRSLNVGYSTGDYFHYPDVSGSKVVYGVGSACDFTWDLKCKDLQTGDVGSYSAGGIDTQPKIDGDIIVWSGGIGFGSPWYHEPSNVSIFAKDIRTGAQQTLRHHSWSESYSHPAVSGKKVVWLEHLGLDPRPTGSGQANNWWNTPYNICGADITSLSSPRYFTVALNVGTRDPYPCYSYSSDFDDVVDICGNIVVWEGYGDIYGADISDLNDIKVFGICTDGGRQFDPAISGNIVVWTDQRNDGGDIYGADISDTNNIHMFEVIRGYGAEQQPAIDDGLIVYIEAQSGWDLSGYIKACQVARPHGVLEVPLAGSAQGMGPAIDGEIVVWQTNAYGKARGILLQAKLDTDGDGMPDEWELANGLLPWQDDSQSDADGDSLANVDEYINGCNPNDPDTD